MKIICRYIAFFTFAICTTTFFASCSFFRGDIIKVTVAPENSSGLKPEVSAKLQEVKPPGYNSQGINVIPKDARTLSVAEYFQQFPDAGAQGAGEYTVGPGDVLSITMYDEKELTIPAVRVAIDGYISYPFLGRVKVQDLSVAQIEELITKKLAAGQYLLDPHVTVLIKEYASKMYMVLGAVQKPGEYPLATNERVLNAISKAAGGIPQEGQALQGIGRRAKLIRTIYPGTPKQEQVVIDINLSDLVQGIGTEANLYLMDKDTLFVSMPAKFFVMGEVKKPGAYPLYDREITLIEGIGTAGGFTNIAARNSTKIIRSENGQEKTIEVKVDAITDTGRQLRDIILQPNDVILVPESFF